MLAKNLLDKIEFTPEMKEDYYKYKSLLGDKLDPYVKQYMDGVLQYKELVEELKVFETEEIHKYTVHLIFILECTDILEKRYNEAGIPHEIFIQTMKDITCKVIECMDVKGVFGTFVLLWYDLFFRMKVFALGRLQYELLIHKGDEITLKNYVIKDGDFMLNCHIPGTGPLRHSECLESYRMAYEFFKGKYKGDILPIYCSSWLLYPPYEKTFEVSANITNFAKDFELYLVQMQYQQLFL